MLFTMKIRSFMPLNTLEFHYILLNNNPYLKDAQ